MSATDSSSNSTTSISAGRPPRWFRRRTVPMPTWRTWLGFALMAAGCVYLLVRTLHDWLSVTEPVDSATYVVAEGWAPDYVLETARQWAEDHEARTIFTTGIPLDAGGLLQEYKDYAHLSAASLAAMGYERARIMPVPALEVQTERTRAMAMALKSALDKMNIPAAEKKLNIFTLGTHGRRSHRIFRQVLGSDWQVGIISVPNRSYNPRAWYRHSAGAKSVIDEVVALTVQSGSGE